jgi:hypothetical protein
MTGSSSRSRTSGDSGRTQFDYSEILGSAGAASISTFSFHPHGDRDLSNALSAKEFWPDIRRKLRKHN